MALAALARSAAAIGQSAQAGARILEHGDEAEDESRQNRYRESEEERGNIEADLLQPWEPARTNGDKQSQATVGEEGSGDSAARRQYQALGEKLAGDVA